MRVPFFCLAMTAAAWLQGEVQVVITKPAPGEVLFGEVTIAAEVTASEPISKVTFYVDGRLTRELPKPPFEVVTDIGQDNAEHHLRVVARTVGGQTGEGVLVSPRIVVDQEVTFELQQLYVSVSLDGVRQLDLERGEFEILDDGSGQEILTFARGDVPLTAVVLLDASTSMRGPRFAAALAGARAFFGGMRGLDEGKLVVYNDRTLLSTPFTNVSEVLLAGLDHLVAGGGTTLNDQLYLALKQIETRQGRRVIVVLSDGLDANSVLGAPDILLKVRQSQALVYWIRMQEQGAKDDEMPSLFSAWRNAAWYRQQIKVLGEAVVESGGRVATVRSVGEVAPAFAEVMRELREQYVLGYYPSVQKNDGRWHRVRVKVQRRGLEVRAREGYLDM